MKAKDKQRKNTRGFSEPLYTIAHQKKVVAVIGADSPEQALDRFQIVREALEIPPAAAGENPDDGLRAAFLESGPVTNAGYFSAKFFLAQQKDDAAS